MTLVLGIEETVKVILLAFLSQGFGCMYVLSLVPATSAITNGDSGILSKGDLGVCILE